MNKLLLFSFLLAGCSSAPPTNQTYVSNAGEEKVLSRIDDLSSRPKYITESAPFRVEGGKVYTLGMTTIPAGDNISAAFRIAENNAKALVSSAIENRLDFVFQNAEEGTAIGANQSRYIGSEASQLTTSSMRLSKRYWEKVSIVQESGQVSLQYRVFALLEMPEQDFRSAIIDAVRRSQGKLGISEEFAKKVDEHWDKFVNGNGVKTVLPDHTIVYRQHTEEEK